MKIQPRFTIKKIPSRSFKSRVTKACIYIYQEFLKSKFNSIKRVMS
jgi:hypothetical protein